VECHQDFTELDAPLFLLVLVLSRLPILAKECMIGKDLFTNMKNEQ